MRPDVCRKGAQALNATSLVSQYRRGKNFAAEAYRRAAGVARRHAMLISAAANGVSFVAGVMLGN